MSLSNRLRSVQRIIIDLKRWPDDSEKVYTSFRNAQIERFEEALQGTQTKITADLDLQPAVIEKLNQNVNKQMVRSERYVNE